MNYQIAIDGPAGAGKSTIAKIVAKRLGFIYVDTGAMYRSAALYFQKSGLSDAVLAQLPEETIETLLKALIDSLHISIRREDGVQRIYLERDDVSDRIRTEEIGALASLTSRYAPVREFLGALQKEIAEQQSVVMDGRDIGTCVLPNAHLKIYLTASCRTRAERRWKQLKEAGKEVPSIEEIEEEIAKRDEQDMNRPLSPLRQAEDAVVIDSSALSIEEVAERILTAFEQRKEK